MKSRGIRKFELDHLRVLATFGVIALHCGAALVVLNRDSRPDLVSAFNLGNAFDSFGRFAVNCFFMVSGALLLDPARSFRLAKQVGRVLWPLLTWIVIYAVANVWFNDHGIRGVGGSLRNPDSWSDAVRAAITAPAVYHLWFVYALLGIYLVVPLLRPITRLEDPERRRLVGYLLIVWLVVEVGRGVAMRLWDDVPVPHGQLLEHAPVSYLGLFVLGFAITHYRAPIPAWFYGAVAITGLVWTFMAVWLGSRAGAPDYLWAYHNHLPPVLLYSIGVFGFVAGRPRGPGRAWPVVSRLSALSFRIYLAHALVLHLIRFMTPVGDWLTTRPLIGIVTLYVGACGISVVVAWLIDFVKPARRFV